MRRYCWQTIAFAYNICKLQHSNHWVIAVHSYSHHGACSPNTVCLPLPSRTYKQGTHSVELHHDHWLHSHESFSTIWSHSRTFTCWLPCWLPCHQQCLYFCAKHWYGLHPDEWIIIGRLLTFPPLKHWLFINSYKIDGGISLQKLFKTLQKLCFRPKTPQNKQTDGVPSK